MLDFLILYEHRNRELENACLLAAELELRGYSTKIVNFYSGNKYWMNPSVLLVPHLYNDDQLVSFCDNYKHNNFKIINLQYEQILRNNQHNGIHNPSGEAIHAQHMAWGEAQKERYLSHGVNRDNIHVAGHIGMDLNRKEFDSYFMSRDEVAARTNLDKTKKWILFISTFGYRLRSKEDIDALQNVDPTTYQGVRLTNEAQEKIEEWLINAAKANKDAIIIYRRHPSEREDPKLLELEKQFSNFRCIDDFTIRQWVRTADLMYTWYSSSIADVYYANKMCYIVRPYDVPEDFELDIMHGLKFIKDYAEFEKSIQDGINEDEFPISDRTMEYYYSFNRKNAKWAFKQWADTCITVFKDKKYMYKYNYRQIKRSYRTSFFVKIKHFIYCLIFNLCTVVNFQFRIDKNSSKFLHNINKYSREVYGTGRYVRQVKKQFKEIIRQL